MEDQYGSAIGRAVLGIMEVQSGDYNEAEKYYRESYAIFEKHADRHFMNVCRSGLADIARLTGDFPRAREIYLETIAEWVAIGNLGAAARCLECLAFISIQQAKSGAADQRQLLQRAANLFGCADTLRDSNNSPMTGEESPEYDQYMTELKSLLEPRELTLAWEAGRSLRLQEAVAFAGQSGCLLTQPLA